MPQYNINRSAVIKSDSIGFPMPERFTSPPRASSSVIIRYEIIQPGNRHKCVHNARDAARNQIDDHLIDCAQTDAQWRVTGWPRAKAPSILGGL